MPFAPRGDMQWKQAGSMARAERERGGKKEAQPHSSIYSPSHLHLFTMANPMSSFPSLKYSPEKSLRIVVTGAGGFIAGALAHRLHTQENNPGVAKHTVVCADWRRADYRKVREKALCGERVSSDRLSNHAHGGVEEATADRLVCPRGGGTAVLAVAAASARMERSALSVTRRWRERAALLLPGAAAPVAPLAAPAATTLCVAGVS